MLASAGRLRTGLLYRATDDAWSLVELARAADDRGFDTIVAAEHTHIPVSRATPYPAGGELPNLYKRILDPYIALAFVAAQTSLEIATCVALVAQHDPIVLAKCLATLDHLSSGRLTLGVGFGWNREEFDQHGRDFTRRREIAREHVELMRTIWRDDVAEYHGRHVHLDPSWSWPKPGHEIPVLLGCAPTPKGFGEVASWADGWIPGGSNADLLAGWLTTLRREWERAGRDARGPVVWRMQDVVGDDELESQLDRLEGLGVDQVLLDLPTAGRDEVMPILDRYANVIRTRSA